MKPPANVTSDPTVVTPETPRCHNGGHIRGLGRAVPLCAAFGAGPMCARVNYPRHISHIVTMRTELWGLTDHGVSHLL